MYVYALHVIHCFVMERENVSVMERENVSVMERENVRAGDTCMRKSGKEPLQ